MKTYTYFQTLPLNLNCNSILLIGAGGKTGIWYAQLLLDKGKHVFAYDKKYNGSNAESIYPPNIFNNPNFYLVQEDEYQSSSVLAQVDSVTFSPGVSLQQSIFEEANRRKYTIFSELEFCIPLLKQYTLVGVTGTDGKSTTVSLIAHILNTFKVNTLACGNLGIPLSEIIISYSHKNIQCLVIELSSYQLELSRNLGLAVALFLNLAPDHLDRYANLSEYEMAKWNIANNAENVIIDTKLINKKIKNQSYDVIDTLLLHSNLFSWKYIKSNGYILQHRSSFLGKSYTTKIVNSKQLTLQGKHNLSNILFALEACYKILKKTRILTLQSFNRALISFKPLPHRFELVYRNNNVHFINDSKATTMQSVRKALENIDNNSYLFLGGKGKGEDYSVLEDILLLKNIHIILFGEERYAMQKALGSKCTIIGLYDTLDLAFKATIEHYTVAKQQGVVTFLLAPGCTSWDQYKNFEERGDHFKSLVQKAFINKKG